MSKLAAALHRFPDRELEIHRLSGRSTEFASACEDFADALTAYDHWRAVGAAGEVRADEYRDLVEELAAELLARLDAERRDKHLPGGEGQGHNVD